MSYYLVTVRVKSGLTKGGVRKAMEDYHDTDVVEVEDACVSCRRGPQEKGELCDECHKAMEFGIHE